MARCFHGVAVSPASPSASALPWQQLAAPQPRSARLARRDRRKTSSARFEAARQAAREEMRAPEVASR